MFTTGLMLIFLFIGNAIYNSDVPSAALLNTTGVIRYYFVSFKYIVGIARAVCTQIFVDVAETRFPRKYADFLKSLRQLSTR